MKKIILAQFIVLLGGTLFAWANFIMEFLKWTGKSARTTGCAGGLVNPFLSSCFYGAIFFTIALILSIIILKKSQK
ncbi:MAG: hypothetical protein COZ91_01535 [Candidatus Nealsonbacteria bacterium CG_4_8_14_3_um_filter_39_7]|uniref:Vitamin K epoxide reductase domain-containing protein n=1 Tax=Candidatus Nealsonbacteria bacterium CG23_combo_of_CG06-09_8_20_14_all_39_17 TaxID=1974722 RepID=A0A2G9YUX3_9BACT|nr:MAG: hypothetical protein COX37_00615 [Candidatus Nealsonbacteria bacterium CG23_combo_of_CG06-09_8_20_14_all_39_17]PIU43693.1 MAG: hypothetical protein COS96_03075 [Candidatus Nealsonbacteria bacterium CG07_land_8_20_14_0_80_39_13]PIW91237.1 MAG: hypothetical protein COZ91_01535 [Candidatus Nealsonbacteria bacterium CG_4_8_14_3_um_filter_39_7]